MRVLIVTGLYPPNDVGGYEIACASFVDHLERAGHQVRVLAADHATPAVEEAPRIVRALEWYRDATLGYRGVSWRGRLALERRNHAVLDAQLEDFRPDVVNWWAMGGMSLSLLEGVRRRGLPAIGMVSDEWMVYAPKVDGWIRAFRTRPTLGRLIGALTGLPTTLDYSSAGWWSFVSEHLRASVAAQGEQVGRAVIGHTGIDAARLAPGPVRPFAGRLLYVGRVAAVKGVDVALRATAALPEAFTLRVVGAPDPAYAPELAALETELGLGPRLITEPFLPRTGLGEVYAGSDALLFPVRWEEPWGLVPLEAMACGLPVIATGTGGSSEYLEHERNCLIVPRGDANALAAAIRRLADDDSLRATLREHGLETAARFPEARCNAVFAAQLSAVAAGRDPA